MSARNENPHEPPGGSAPLAGLVFGPTASGKTDLVVALSRSLPIEIVSADSRQVYRHLDIGTAKPSAAERAAVTHHLIDFLELHETYNAARFAADALQLAAEIRARGRIPLVVGGAGFYFKVLEEGLFEPPFDAELLSGVRSELQHWTIEELHAALLERDPQRAAAIHPNDRYRLARALEICIASGRSVTELTAERRRPARPFVRFRIRMERPELHRRIQARARAMVDSGWVEEVRTLLQSGVAPDVPGLATLGYPHVVAHLGGRIDRERLVELVVRDTRRFARAQETWFRKARDATPVAGGVPGSVEAIRSGLARAFGEGRT